MRAIRRHISIMTRAIALTLLAAAAIAPPAPAFAVDCAPVSALATQAAEGAARELLAPELATCRMATEAAGQTLFCFTAHPFRSEAAQDAFAALGARISACLPDSAVQTEDAAVNHPDSYDALAWAAPDARISLSLKDKGGEGRTLIFLRISP